MESHDHEHEDGEERFGLALGFRILETGGELYLAEVEIVPYVDEPNALGATLVFHPLNGLDPAAEEEDDDSPVWQTDFDDELTRETTAPLAQQFQAIARQVSKLSEAELVQLLDRAKTETAEVDSE